ncbi:glucose-6-phosphate 1-epimerase [Citrus sinensis]|uniref:Glucose-6-phosphate 1-epimerase n=1 Tax=Citrus sinensis TaxID=2711 RepID=A0ACB8P5Q0_CITSI|nr:glucose-6-phosphate 1-epimerase [Citrus sinensis]
MSTEKFLPVEFCKGNNGLDKVVLRESRGSSAEVYLYGGHVTSWKNDHGEELLFVSSKFASLGSLESHGFARNRFWSIDTDPPAFPTNSSSKAYIDLILRPSEEDLKIWPHSFEFRLRVALTPGGDLMLISRVRNTSTDGKPFSFTFAYHTYFSVSDIRCSETKSSITATIYHHWTTLDREIEFHFVNGELLSYMLCVLWLRVCYLPFQGSEVRVEGLETLDYLDNLQNKERFTEQGDAITFESEVDKIYLSTPTKIAILDHEKKRTFVIRKDGLPDAGEIASTLVWNPWDKKAKAMADFGDDEYKHMLCVEAAAVEKPITLKPGEEWKGRLELSGVPSSYCSGQLDPQKVLSSS